jgi:cephalosporin hydroxylase
MEDTGVDPNAAFMQQRAQRIASYADDDALRTASRAFLAELVRAEYTYNFTWLGRPVIQIPQDLYALQEIIWEVKPDLIVETGIAHGGSLIASASMLALLDYCEAAEQGRTIAPGKSARRVLGIDIDIRPHNRQAIAAHPLAGLIDMIEGSSVDDEIVTRVKAAAENHARIMVCLDSNHTHEHVLAELEAYAPLVSQGSYCIVWDTGIEEFAPSESACVRPWGKGNNPLTALREYLHRLNTEQRVGTDGAALNFEIDRTIENKLLITAALGGFMRRTTATPRPAR